MRTYTQRSRQGGKTNLTVRQIQTYIQQGAQVYVQCRVSRKGPVWSRLRITGIRQDKEGTMGLVKGRWYLTGGNIEIYEQTKLALE